MSNFATLKKNRASALENLTKELNKAANNTTQSSGKDDRFWAPEVDKAGNGSAIIRFLPAPNGEDVPFVRIWDHGFQGPGGWYIEKSLTTIGKPDPVAEYNSMLWNASTDDNSPTRKQARDQKRRLSFISNIYVVKDPANPANEGKVFLYKYGKKIFDKLNDLMNPQFDDEKPVNPFDLWEGANFRLRIRKFEGYRNYDKSEFEQPSTLLDDDSELEAVYNKEYSLQAFLDPKEFKTYEELKTRLNKVLGDPTTSANKPKAKSAEDDEIWEEATPAPKLAAKPAPSLKSVSTDDDDEDDDSLDFFKKLADE